jgi:hypothetical protein
MLANGSGNGWVPGIKPMLAFTSPCAETEGAKLATANQPFARLLPMNGMDRLVLSLKEIGSS